MLEVMVVVVIILIISGMAIIRMQPAVQQSRANAAMTEVVTAFRTAREYAVGYRRFVQVSFPNYPSTKNQIQITVLNHLTVGAGNDTTLSIVTFPSTVNYQTYGGLPDTPESFGKSSSVNFNGVDGGPTAGMMFQPDGTFVDTTGNPVSGTVFVGVNNFPESARAITVLGATGRVKSYFGNTYGWTQVH